MKRSPTVRLLLMGTAPVLLTACANRPPEYANFFDGGGLTGAYDTPPSVARHVALAYPGERLQRGTEGAATVEFTITPSGYLDDFRVIETTHPAFAGYLLLKLKGWRFEPARLNGQPVPVTFRREFTFRIGAPTPRQRRQPDVPAEEDSSPGPTVVDPIDPGRPS